MDETLQNDEEISRSARNDTGEGRNDTAEATGSGLRATDCPKCDEYLAGWKRAQADYLNLKKESERERMEFGKYANARLLEELLPTLDQFSLAMRHVPDASKLADGERKTWENWLIGLKAVQSLWEQAAKVQGLERIAAEGSFDPSLHEAVGEEEAENVEAGSISRITEDGWKLHGKVIRPAKVILAK
jgi:molecular chaperone GrpE